MPKLFQTSLHNRNISNILTKDNSLIKFSNVRMKSTNKICTPFMKFNNGFTSQTEFFFSKKNSAAKEHAHSLSRALNTDNSSENKVSIHRVLSDEKHTLQNMLELYCYDFTEFCDFDLDKDGLYGYPLNKYWNDPEHYAYFIKYTEKLAGFALVDNIKNQEDNLQRNMKEFFILKKYRRHNLGTTAAELIFNALPGHWRIHQIEKNHPAISFWRKVVAKNTCGEYKEHFDDNKVIQKFHIKKSSPQSCPEFIRKM